MRKSASRCRDGVSEHDDRRFRQILQVVAVSIPIGACYCSRGSTGGIVGRWTSHEQGYDNLLVDFRADGTFTLSGRTYVIKDQKIGPIDVSEDGLYSSTTNRLSIEAKHVNFSTTDPGTEIDVKRFHGSHDAGFLIPVSSSGPIHWTSKNEFVSTCAYAGNDMIVSRV